MPKTKISEFSATPANNTDIDSINIAEGCAPSGINDAIRELMAQLKDFQTGAVGDSFNGPIGTSTAAAGAFTTLAASGAVTLSGGTANGVTYLNGSKVLTSGSALTFDGANVIINATTPAYFTGTSNLAQISINRSPSTGAIFNASQSAAYLNIDGASGGSSIQFVVASAANTQPSEQMRLNSYGIGLGGTTPSSGTGITFPATQSASSNANTLDDYEEGTWNVVVKNDNSTTVTVSVGAARYVKIGRTVNCTLIFDRGDAATLTGAVTFDLPFPSQQSGSNYASYGTFWTSFATGVVLLDNYANNIGNFAFGYNNLTFSYLNFGAITNTVQNGNRVFSSFTYETDA
jgi:hypothetical protein